jgi:hypothetical protein
MSRKWFKKRAISQAVPDGIGRELRSPDHGEQASFPIFSEVVPSPILLAA